MSKAPAFQFYAAEYLADERVQLMTIEEEGVYIRLLSYCWREGSIPADPALLTRLCKGSDVSRMPLVLEAFAPMIDDHRRLIHTRLEKEREKQSEYRQQQRERGSHGGRVSAKKRVAAAQAPATPPANPALEPALKPDSSSSSSSSSSPSSLEAHTSACAHAPKIEEVKAAAETFPTLPKPDPEFCAWWWDEQEKCGWVDPRNHLPWHNWKAAFSAAWRGALHNRRERESRRQPPNGKSRNTPPIIGTHKAGDKSLL